MIMPLLSDDEEVLVLGYTISLLREPESPDLITVHHSTEHGADHDNGKQAC